MLEKGCGFHMSGSNKMQGLSSSPGDVNTPDSMVYQMDVPNSAELPPDAEGISRVPSSSLREHFGYSLLSNQVLMALETEA